MKWFAAILLVACLLSGCANWMDGSYVSETPHMANQNDNGQDMEWISNVDQLYEAVQTMVSRGITSDLFFIRDYGPKSLSGDMVQVRYKIMNSDPIGAYAVLNIAYEEGINGGQSTLAVNIEYSHQSSDILRIPKVHGTEDAKRVIISELEKLRAGVALYVEDYEAADFEQIVEDYALQQPDKIMELPQVNVSVYPDQGDDRVVELNFTYQTSRDVLRNMQIQVERVFESAELYVGGDETTREKLTYLYTFLMERSEYKIETATTPAYSLLMHGVGDSKAFAVVFAAMCRQVGVECLTVSGTRDGESWFWNMVKEDDAYCHIDLLRCVEEGEFWEHSDEQMEGYVWDYSAYPACDRQVPIEVEDPVEETQWQEEPDPMDIDETTESTEVIENATLQPEVIEETAAE